MCVHFLLYKSFFVCLFSKILPYVVKQNELIYLVRLFSEFVIFQSACPM